MFPKHFKKLRLFALDPYDLALSKLERNAALDRDDVRHLAQAVPLVPAILRQRYEKEMRPNLANADREDLTLKLWLEAFFEGADKPRAAGDGAPTTRQIRHRPPKRRN
jgi:hypothetical protein